ncbi:MAG: phosphoribosylamine--glycine ligase [Chitinophagales bacterium]|nr:phosphoribosylamine--glycine ligase [Chitinophagales bacterium]
MNILLIGSGGRENAFARQIAKSKLCSQLFIAPGNPGTIQYGENVAVNATDFEGIKQFVLENDVKMVVVGPEAPLVKGIFDYFKNDVEIAHIPVIGPSQKGALLEGSKAFSKAFMVRNNIPTAAYREFTADEMQTGLDYIQTQSLPIVLKADGLAAGKGVLICQSIEEAQQEFKNMLSGKFGSAGDKVVIEEFMSGIEFSVFVLSDGENYKILPVAKDYKRIGEKDTGLNTGGMGAVSPPSFVTESIMQKVEREVIIPTVKGLQKENISYKGIIYIGLMNTAGDTPKVVEYNCRMGDPEAQVVLPRIESDFVELLQHVADETLNQAELKISDEAAVTVILASGGYPEDFVKGYEITGAKDNGDTIIYHAGTKMQGVQLVTNGGRVLAVTTLDKDWLKALDASNKIAEKIQFQDKYYRRDIGFDLI